MTKTALAAKLFGKRYPLNIMLAVTNRCDGHCAICRIPQREMEEMSLTDIRRLLDEAAVLGCRRLGIWGGEPLLRKDLGEIIACAKKLKMFVTVDTNGHLLPYCDETLRQVDHLNISLDGGKTAHDAIRGDGAWDKTMNAIKHASSRYRYWTITVLHKHNLDQIDWLLETAGHYGFQTTFQTLHHNEHLGNNDSFQPNNDDLRRTVDYLIQRKSAGAPIASSFTFLHLLRDWADYRVIRRSGRMGSTPCLAGKLYCNIDVNGDLYPCSLLIDEIAPPNTLKMGFAAAFENLRPAPCQSCLATCFSEYNLMFNLHTRTIWNWWRALHA